MKESLKLEAGLWTLHEAIDKASAVELLRAKHPYYDDKTIGIFYESLKAGLYNARNYALRDLGNLKREVGDGDGAAATRQGPPADWARVVLTRLKEDYEEFIARKL